MTELALDKAYATTLYCPETCLKSVENCLGDGTAVEIIYLCVAAKHK